MFNRLTTREKIIFAVCLFLAIVFVLYKFVFNPLVNNQKSLNQKIEKTKKKYVKTQRTIQEAKSLQGLYDQYLSEFKQRESNEQTVAYLISEIEKVSTQINLVISDLKPKPVKPDKTFNYYSISLSIEGPWTDILKLIHLLQSQPYLFEVEEMNLDRASQRNPESVRAYLMLGKNYIP